MLAQVSTHDIGSARARGILSQAVRLAGRAVEVAVQSISASVGPHFAVGFRCRSVLHASVAGLARGYERFAKLLARLRRHPSVLDIDSQIQRGSPESHSVIVFSVLSGYQPQHAQRGPPVNRSISVQLHPQVSNVPKCITFSDLGGGDRSHGPGGCVGTRQPAPFRGSGRWAQGRI